MAVSTIKNQGLQTRKISFSWSAAANEVYSANIYNLINNDMPSGYRCLGIVGYSTGQNQQMVVYLRYVNSSNSYTARNMVSDNRNGTAEIWYLCTPI